MDNVVLEKVKPCVKIISYEPQALQLIASASKSTLSSRDLNDIMDRMDQEAIEKWIGELVRRNHGSPLEHSHYTFEITCSRVTSHQIVRHRIASYTQLSQRFSDKYIRSMVSRALNKLGMDGLEKNSSYNEYVEALSRILGEELGFMELLDIVGEAFIIPPNTVLSRDSSYLRGIIESVLKYYKLLLNGYSFEDARYVLPQSVKTRLVVTMNARELVESFLQLRMCSRAQWEVRYIAWRLWGLLMNTHPTLFRYAGPRCIYMDNRVRRELCSLYDYVNGACYPEIARCPEMVEREHIVECLRNASRDPWS